jgi:uncharacterized DUF497 family protein
VIFKWDDGEAASNHAKHRVSFELARQVWSDPLYLVLPGRVEGGEQRWHAIGMIGAVVVLVVVHSHPRPDDEDRVRIISARKATAHERKRYEQESA